MYIINWVLLRVYLMILMTITHGTLGLCLLIGSRLKFIFTFFFWFFYNLTCYVLDSICIIWDIKHLCLGILIVFLFLFHNDVTFGYLNSLFCWLIAKEGERERERERERGQNWCANINLDLFVCEYERSKFLWGN